MVSETEGHFDRENARALTELAAFVDIALRMLRTKRQLKTALEGQELLAKEMSHRVKNLFAVTDGMVRISARNASSTEEMAKALSSRIHALASAHTLVSRNLRDVGHANRASDLTALIRAVVLPHERAGSEGSRFILDGPPIPCGDQAMNSIALVFHEMATNAAKYGALSTDDGVVDVRWREEAGKLILVWTESHGPFLQAPASATGFGSALVKKTITSQFSGSLDYDWRPEGLVVSMSFPVEKLTI